MADNVQWIRLMVGTFDGSSFKKIKRAKIGGVSYRDKLTAVWFELLDLAGKSNANGYLVDNNGVPYQTYEDIGAQIDRDEKEVELCLGFFEAENMVEIYNDTYLLTNFMQYQNQEGLEKIREKKRVAQSKWRERKRLGLVGVDKKQSTKQSTSGLPSNSISTSLSNSNFYSNGGGKNNNNLTTTARACVCEGEITVEKFEQLAECEGWERYPNGEVYREIRDAAFKLIGDGEMTIDDISRELVCQILDSMYIGRERRQIVDLPKYILAIVKRLRKAKAGE